MRTKFYLLLFLATITIFGATVSVAWAKHLKIAFSYDIPPFVIDNATRGIEVDIVSEALKHGGHTFEVLQCSYRRLQIAVSEMGLDGAAAVRQSEDGTYYSDYFIDFKNFAITRKKDNITINSVADLKGKYIFAWQNAYRDLGEEFHALFSPYVTAPYRKKYKEIAIQKDQVESFWRGRGGLVIVIDEAIFKWFTKQLSTQMNTTDELTYHKIFDNTTEFQVNFKDQALRDDFNRGLEHIRATGKYEEILKKYQ